MKGSTEPNRPRRDVADAIAIGRPYLWGLGDFGQEGVETVLDLLQRELEIVMRQARTTSIEEITRSIIA
jgi:isopentenyl diphosphate isomerase/L-lactate dehydrogenase-like FMN-dependent dehydrogenase